MPNKTLKTFRVRPHAYERLLEHTRSTENRSACIRQILQQACAAPPAGFPRREIKADLTAFSVFLDVEQNEELGDCARRAGVSKNLFVEAVLANLQ